MLLSALLYAYRSQGIEKSLLRIIYYDYRGYDRDIIKKPQNYFLGAQDIPTEPPVAIECKSVAHGVEKVASAESRQGNVLQLKENRDFVATERENILINNAVSQNAETTKGDININNLTPVSKGLITIPDYEELLPRELLKFDKRTTFAYLKDLMILDHTILSLVFRKSLKDPLFIRVLQVVYSFSMQFAINAMLYTDGVIDERQSKLADVTMIFNKDELYRRNLIRPTENDDGFDFFKYTVLLYITADYERKEFKRERFK
jgi:hypothetical protein